MPRRVRSLATVDFNLLKALDALLQERSVTRAAERLSITQPSMSSTLGRLRELFADELLIRTGRAMRPTPLAEALEPRIRRIVGDIEDIVVSNLEFDPEHGEPSFRILATDYASLVLVQPCDGGSGHRGAECPDSPPTEGSDRTHETPAAR